MKSLLTIAVGAVAAVTLAGCSSATSTQSQNVAQPTSTTSVQTGASPATAATTSPSTPASTTTTSAALAKPVSALLAGVAAPVTTANMPQAKSEWIAAIQKTDDMGKSFAGKDIRNLAALVDEAAKTSDADALVKLCNLCDSQKLQRMLTATDSAGLTGFQELSRVLEKTHPAPSYTQSTGWNFPGFTTPEKGAATALDQQDMRLLGVYEHPYPYTMMRAQFMNLNDGPNPYDGWTGLGSPNT